MTPEEAAAEAAEKYPVGHGLAHYSGRTASTMSIIELLQAGERLMRCHPDPIEYVFIPPYTLGSRRPRFESSPTMERAALIPAGNGNIWVMVGYEAMLGIGQASDQHIQMGEVCYQPPGSTNNEWCSRIYWRRGVFTANFVVMHYRGTEGTGLAMPADEARVRWVRAQLAQARL